MKQYLEESMAIPEKIYETNGAEETFEVGMRLAKEAKPVTFIVLTVI